MIGTILVLSLVAASVSESVPAVRNATPGFITSTPVSSRPSYTPRSSDRARALFAAIQNFNRGQYARAESTALEVLSVYPDDTTALTIAGAARLKSQNCTGAIALFRTYTNLYPFDALARFYLGLSYHFAGNRAAALDQYAQAILLDPELTAARENLDQLSRP